MINMNQFENLIFSLVTKYISMPNVLENLKYAFNSNLSTLMHCNSIDAQVQFNAKFIFFYLWSLTERCLELIVKKRNKKINNQIPLSLSLIFIVSVNWISFTLCHCFIILINDDSTSAELWHFFKTLKIIHAPVIFVIEMR